MRDRNKDRKCEQCGARPPTLQRYNCSACGWPTPEAKVNCRHEGLPETPHPIDPNYPRHKSEKT